RDERIHAPLIAVDQRAQRTLLTGARPGQGEIVELPLVGERRVLLRALYRGHGRLPRCVHYPIPRRGSRPVPSTRAPGPEGETGRREGEKIPGGPRIVDSQGWEE